MFRPMRESGWSGFWKIPSFLWLTVLESSESEDDGCEPIPLPRFRIVIIALCLSYFALQLIYVFGMPLAMDEFDGAYDVKLLESQVPYADFRPYKTVLGYYIQLPALIMARSLWGGLMAVKCQMALINAIMMLIAAWVLSQRNRRIAVIVSLSLLCCMSTYLERSSDLRVDMLTAWAGLGSLLFLLHRKAGWAGLLAGISFLISQKGIYYLVAANAAILVLGLIAIQKRQALYQWIRFNAAAGASLALYIAAWSALSSFDTVIKKTFFAHGQIAFGYLYDIRMQFWLQTLIRNPFFYAMAAISLAYMAWLMATRVHDKRQVEYYDLALLVYGATILAGGIWHHQPWPYFFVILIPTIFVLHVRGFDRFIRYSHPIYRHYVLWALIAGFGILYPLTRLAVTLRRDSGFQKHMVELGSRLMNEGDTYLAGMDVIYDRKQNPSALRRLDNARLEYLKRIFSKEQALILSDIEKQPPKFYLDNYRTRKVPVFLKAYLDDNYLPFWGCIQLYAPAVDSGSRELHIAFTGTYRTMGPHSATQSSVDRDSVVIIDDRAYRFEEKVELSRGQHRVNANTAFRLVFVPRDVDNLKDKRYLMCSPFFPEIYTY